MSKRCELCGKGPVSGNLISHSKRHTRRRWLPNLISVRLPICGFLKKLRICTTCLRTHTKNQTSKVSA